MEVQLNKPNAWSDGQISRTKIKVFLYIYSRTAAYKNIVHDFICITLVLH